MFRIARVFVGALCALVLGAAPPGHAVLARATGEALILWDATPVVASIVRDKLSDAAANALLERDAAGVLAEMAPNVDRAATSVTVRVLYAETGAVSPVYGTPTFAGVERYASLTVSGTDARSDRDRWRQLGPSAPLPRWLAFKVTGLLPPRH
jgi:hypothetical protein